jgi:drug/metabolite transporter (DMT)-like permease
MTGRSKPLSTSAPPAALAASAVAFTVLVWASAFPLIRVAVRELAPLPLAAVRFAIAGALFVVWLAWARPRLPSLADSARFALCGLVGIALYNGLLNAGERTVSAGAAAFIINAVPMLTAILATAFLRERISTVGLAAMLTSSAGVVLIALDQPGGLSFGTGATMVLGAAACQATYFALLRPLVTRYGALQCTAYTFLAGALLLSPWFADGAAALASASVSRATIAAVVALGVFPGALGFVTWSYVLGQFGAVRATNFLYLVPPLATCLAVVLAGEFPGLRTLFGGAIAVAGVILFNARGRAEISAPSSAVQCTNYAEADRSA